MACARVGSVTGFGGCSPSKRPRKINPAKRGNIGQQTDNAERPSFMHVVARFLPPDLRSDDNGHHPHDVAEDGQGHSRRNQHAALPPRLEAKHGIDDGHRYRGEQAANPAACRRHVILIMAGRIDQRRAHPQNINLQNVTRNQLHRPTDQQPQGKGDGHRRPPQRHTEGEQAEREEALLQPLGSPRQAHQTVNADEQRDDRDAWLLDHVPQQVQHQCQRHHQNPRPSRSGAAGPATACVSTRTAPRPRRESISHGCRPWRPRPQQRHRRRASTTGARPWGYSPA